VESPCETPRRLLYRLALRVSDECQTGSTSNGNQDQAEDKDAGEDEEKQNADVGVGRTGSMKSYIQNQMRVMALLVVRTTPTRLSGFWLRY
jgi:hypothetical protein